MTLWYHPHMDGASAMQLYGGMAGAFIIKNDAVDELYGINNLKSDVFVLQLLNFNPMVPDYIGAFMANANNGVPTSDLPLNLVNPDNFDGILMLSNNEVAPQTSWSLDIGEQGILKLINGMSASANIANLAFTGTSASACTIDVMAMDGVYFDKVRRQSMVFIPSGGRADVAVTCYTTGLHCLETVDAPATEFGGQFGMTVEPGHKAACVMVETAPVAAPMGGPVPSRVYPATIQSQTVAITNSKLSTSAVQTRAGVPIFLDFVNGRTGSDSTATIEFTGDGSVQCTLQVLAVDGKTLLKPSTKKSIKLPQGSKVTVAAECPLGGLFTISTQTLPNPNLDLFIKVLGQSHQALTTLPGSPLFFTDLTSENIIPTQAGKMTFSNFAGDNVVDNVMFNATVSTEMKKGSIQEWQIYGGEGPTGLENYHPWHMHNTHFQLQEISYNPNNILGYVGDWRDTVPLYLAVNYTIRFVAPFQNRIMVHCHILKHEDLGMMTLWNVWNAPPTHQLPGEDVVVHDGMQTVVPELPTADITKLDELPALGMDLEADGLAKVSVNMLICSSVLSALLGVVGILLFQRIALKRATKMPYEDVEGAQLSSEHGSSDDTPM